MNGQIVVRLFTYMVLCCMLLAGGTVGAEPGSRVLFTFDTPEAGRIWQTVNDGVMGGLSDGRVRMNDARTMEFFGTLSLKNNGGFASVRSRANELSLKKGDVLVARVRGDGRSYFWNLYVPGRRMAFSYRAGFQTQVGEWMEVRMPLSKFYATSFGRRVPNARLNPRKVNSLGFLLSDKRAGPFKLEVEWIKVMPSSAITANASSGPKSTQQNAFAPEGSVDRL